jgi:hypothetical protein
MSVYMFPGEDTVRLQALLIAFFGYVDSVAYMAHGWVRPLWYPNVSMFIRWSRWLDVGSCYGRDGKYA